MIGFSPVEQVWPLSSGLRKFMAGISEMLLRLFLGFALAAVAMA